MKKFGKTLTLILSALLIMVCLSSCGGGATPEPTQDMVAFQTMVVQTFEANSTQTALAMPTETPTPTYTMVAYTPTPELAQVLPPAATVESLPEAAPVEEIINAAAPSPLTEVAVAPTATLAIGGNKASYDSQNPADGAHVKAGSDFDITWYLLNTGTTTWTTDYVVRYYTGTNFTKPGKDRYYLPANVPPNTVGACSVDALAPSSKGTYTMSVVLGNENEENFYNMDITIVVD